MRILWWDNDDPDVEERWLRTLVSKYILPQNKQDNYNVSIAIGGDFAAKMKAERPQYYRENREFVEKYNRRFARVFIKASNGQPITKYVNWLDNRLAVQRKPRVPAVFSRPVQTETGECAVDIMVDTYSAIEIEDEQCF